MNESSNWFCASVDELQLWAQMLNATSNQQNKSDTHTHENTPSFVLQDV